MNPDLPQTPRDEIEARLTALLLGELSAEEAAEVRAQMSANDDLVTLYLRLSQAIDLVREASALPEPPASSNPPRLSDERRARLLAHFQSHEPSPVVIKPHWDWASLVPLGVAALLIALIGGSVFLKGIALSKLSKSPDFAGDLGVSVSSSSVSSGQVRTPEARHAMITPAGAPAEPTLAEVDLPASGVQQLVTDARGGSTGPASTTSTLNFFARGALSSSAADASGIVAPTMPVPTALAGPSAAATSAPDAPAPVEEFGSVGRTTASKSVASNSLGLLTLSGAVGNPVPAATPAPLAITGGAALGGAGGAFTDGEKMQRADRGALGDLADVSSYQRAPAMPAVTVEKPVALTMNGSNAYSGGTTINGGTLEVTKSKPTAWFGEAEHFAAGGKDQSKSLVDADKDGKKEVNGQTFEFKSRQAGEAKEWGVSVKLAEQSVVEGRYKDAGETLKKVLEEKPQDKDAITMLSRLEQPDYYDKTVTPRYRSSVEEVKQDFADADGFYQSGRYDLALKRAEQILNLDPYNIAARKLQEKVNKAIDDYGVMSYDETRSRAVRNLDRAWATPIRRFNLPAGTVVDQTKGENTRTDLTQRKLERIIIPKLEFKEATVREAVEILKQKSRDLDTTEPNPANRGLNFVMKTDGVAGPPAPETAAPSIPGLEAIPGAGPSPATPAVGNPADARITVSLTNIPLSEALRYVTNLAGLKYRIEPNAISIVPASAGTETVVTREFKVAPEVLKLDSADATKGGVDVAKRDSAKHWLEAKGITFGRQSAAIYVPSSNKLIVRNTEDQLDLVEAIVESAESSASKKAAKEEEAENAAAAKKAPDAGEPQPEVATSANPFSTFSLNVSDVSFKLAAASLEQGKMPELATVRSEEFINAFDYCDPEPTGGAPLAFATERARYPFAQNRDLLRLSVKTAAAGRQPGRALNIVLLLDNSGSMERADRVRILHEALRVLCEQLQPQDQLSVVTFARTPRLWADGVAGDKAAEVTARVGEITPQGGTNLDAALDLGYATALRHYQVGSINRVVLLTDGAANLGDVNPDALKQKVETHRKQGVALDCFGIGWEGLDDTLLEALSRNGDGRYGFLNTPEEAATEFAGQLAGALRVAASDVKVQVEFNPRRVTAYRQIGYAKHQLTKEQFRDNTVDAAEIGAAESGNALYVVEVNPRGEGDLATVRVRFKVPGTDDYREHEWTVPFTPNPPPLEQASPALRLAGAASAFSEWLVASPYASEVTTDRLLAFLNGVPATYGADPRPQKLEWMIRQAKSVSGR